MILPWGPMEPGGVIEIETYRPHGALAHETQMLETRHKKLPIAIDAFPFASHGRHQHNLRLIVGPRGTDEAVEINELCI